MSRQTENTRDQDSSWWVFALMVVVVLALMVMGYFWVWSLVPADEWSAFADVFGAIVGTLFGGLAFAGIIWTILLQRHELSLQRQELKETREELTRAADAQEKSEAALNAQVEVAQLAARLNAATALLTHYENSIPAEGLVLATERSDIERAERLNKELLSKRDEVLGEILTLKNSLRYTIEVGPVTMSGVGQATAKATVVMPEDSSKT